MICKACGKNVTKGMAFCNNCGAALDVENKQNDAPLQDDGSKGEAVKNKDKAKAILASVEHATTDAISKLKKASGSKSKDESGLSGESKSNKNTLMVIGGIAVALVVVLILALGIFKTPDTLEAYAILEKEDELVVYDGAKDIMTLDFEGDYGLYINEGVFVLQDQSGDEGLNALYSGYLKKNADVEKVTESVIGYDVSGTTLAYIEQDEEDSVLYVGKIGKMDDAEKVDKDVVNLRVTGDGKGLYYENYDGEVFVYRNGDSDRLAKNAVISNVSEDANQVVLLEDYDKDEQTLVWHKGDKDFEVAEAVMSVNYVDDASLALYVLADWDYEDATGTLYYADKFAKAPIEIDKNVSAVFLDTDFGDKTIKYPSYILYLKDGDYYCQKIGVEGEGKKLMSEDDELELIAYDGKRGVLYMYEDKDEILYFNLGTGKHGAIKLDDDFVGVQIADGEVLYENEDTEVMYVGKKDEVELFSKMTWHMIDGDYIFTAEGVEDDNEAYVYNMHSGQVVNIAEDVHDLSVAGEYVYVLADYDYEDYEGTVYRLKLGSTKPVKIDDGIMNILVIPKQ